MIKQKDNQDKTQMIKTVAKTCMTFVSKSQSDLLKIVAMVSMFIDHVGKTFFAHPEIFVTMGRLAFPIFAYQVAIGFSKTSNLALYIKRLAIFALISQVPYAFFFPAFKFNPFHFNIIFTLLLGLFAIVYFEQAKLLWKKNKFLSAVCGVAIIFLVIGPQLLEMVTLGIFNFSYGAYGVLMVLLFHVFKNSFRGLFFAYLALSIFEVFMAGAMNVYFHSQKLYGMQLSVFGALFSFDKVFQLIVSHKNELLMFQGPLIQLKSILVIPVIFFAKKIELPIKLNKQIVYIFYPAHLVFLLIIAGVIKLIGG